MTEKIRSFTDLQAWKEGHNFVLNIYRITESFPRKEMFGLASQMQRAAVSVTSNIAEGFSRQSNKDKSHFYTMALGSLTELQNELLLARDLAYITNEKFLSVADQSVKIHKLINGLIKYLRNRNT